MDSRKFPEKLDVQCLQQALAHAIRLTLENDSPETQCAWITEDCVWALYPAIYPDIKHFLQRGANATSQASPNKHELLEQLLKAGLIATPRATAVREYRRDRWFSQLNLALEIDPDLIWRSGETRPPICHLTHAMGPYRTQVADLMGLPTSPEDLPQLCLGTLHSSSPKPADPSQALVNPHVVLAIYWKPEDLAPEAETRSVSKKGEPMCTERGKPEQALSSILCSEFQSDLAPETYAQELLVRSAFDVISSVFMFIDMSRYAVDDNLLPTLPKQDERRLLLEAYAAGGGRKAYDWISTHATSGHKYSTQHLPREEEMLLGRVYREFANTLDMYGITPDAIKLLLVRGESGESPQSHHEE